MDVLIADDHPLVRDALATIVRQLDADARVVQVADYPTLVEHVSAEVPDLLLSISTCRECTGSTACVACASSSRRWR